MTSTTRKQSPLPGKNTWSKRWIPIVILLALLLLPAREITLAHSAYKPGPEDLLTQSGQTPTATAAPTRQGQPTATPTPTNAALTTTTSGTSTPGSTVKVGGGSVNLRTGPGINYPTIIRIRYGELLKVLGRVSDNTWLYVEGPKGEKGWISVEWLDVQRYPPNFASYQVKTPPPTPTPPPPLTGIEGRWIDIDLSEQKISAYDGDKLVKSFLVSTGTYEYPTEPGQFHIDVKHRYADMRGADYFLPDVPWVMYYYGDYAIHGTYWHHSFGTPMSHGCVNMDTKDAEWLFNWASVGMLVNIHS